MSTIDVKTIRSSLNLTRQQLAEKVGVDLSTISRWEGKKAVPRGSAQKLLEHLVKSHRPQRKSKQATA